MRHPDVVMMYVCRILELKQKIQQIKFKRYYIPIKDQRATLVLSRDQELIYLENPRSDLPRPNRQQTVND